MDFVVKKCCFCFSYIDDVLQFGVFHEICGIQVHHFCLLLSSKLKQNGRRNEGISGFLLEDIHNEVNRGKILVCTYCKEKGATISCASLNCKNRFHLPCGRLNNSTHRFYGDFKSYCSSHRIIQIVVPISQDPLSLVTCCAICIESIVPWPNINTLCAHCCHFYFHRICVQRLAFTDGCFKCPVCNDKGYFEISMLQQGIFIPSIRREIVHCILCGTEEIFTNNNKVKSVRLVAGCDICTLGSDNQGILADEPGTVSKTSDKVNNHGEMRKSLKFSSNNDSLETGMPGCSTAQCSTSLDTESKIYHFGGSSSQIKKKTISSDIKNETTSDSFSSYCGPVTRSRLGESRGAIRLQTMNLHEEKSKIKREKVAVKMNIKDEGDPLDSDRYITRLRIRKEKRCVLNKQHKN